MSSAYSADLRLSKSLQEGAPALLECLLLTVPDPDEAVNREVRLTASSTSSGSPPWSSRSPVSP